MKLIILLAFIATAVAVPLDDKRPLAPQPISPIDSYKPPLSPDPKAQAPPAVPARQPLHKRDTPKTSDQKTGTAVPVTNTQKAAAVPNPTSGVVKPSNSRPSRDTQKVQDSYKPQPSGVPQKSNSAPLPSNTDSKTSNNRPARDTPKAPQTNTQQLPLKNNQKNSAPVPSSTDSKTSSNIRPSRDTQKTSVTNAQNPSVATPQKNNAPASPVEQKPQQNSRNRRDTVKQTDNQKPVEWNNDDKTKSSIPSQQPSSATADRKIREVPKTDDKTKTPNPSPPATADKRKTRETPKNVPAKDDKTKTSSPTQPEVAKVPLTSSNSRSRRDAPNPAEQSKLVPSGSIAGNPSQQARKEPATTAAPLNSHKRDTQGSSIRYPVPVDQVLKQKNTDEKPATDNTKPIDNSSKKV